MIFTHILYSTHPFMIVSHARVMSTVSDETQVVANVIADLSETSSSAWGTNRQTCARTLARLINHFPTGRPKPKAKTIPHIMRRGNHVKFVHASWAYRYTIPYNYGSIHTFDTSTRSTYATHTHTSIWARVLSMILLITHLITSTTTVQFIYEWTTVSHGRAIITTVIYM